MAIILFATGIGYSADTVWNIVTTADPTTVGFVSAAVALGSKRILSESFRSLSNTYKRRVSIRRLRRRALQTIHRAETYLHRNASDYFPNSGRRREGPIPLGALNEELESRLHFLISKLNSLVSRRDGYRENLPLPPVESDDVDDANLQKIKIREILHQIEATEINIEETREEIRTIKEFRDNRQRFVTELLYLVGSARVSLAEHHEDPSPVHSEKLRYVLQELELALFSSLETM